MPNETEKQRIIREQRELIARLNAARDAKMTPRQQNDMRMRGAPGRPAAPAVPQGSGPNTIPLGGMAGRAQAALGNRLGQIDTYVDRATRSAPKR